MTMKNKASRMLYLLLFCLGWIGVSWTVYAFFMNAYNKTMSDFVENPSFFILLCISLMSIATAYIIEKMD